MREGVRGRGERVREKGVRETEGGRGKEGGRVREGGRERKGRERVSERKGE